VFFDDDMLFLAGQVDDVVITKLGAFTISFSYASPVRDSILVKSLLILQSFMPLGMRY
jgi:hypothetical protein